MRFSFFNLEQNKYSWRHVVTWERFWTLNGKKTPQNQPNTNNKTTTNGLPTVFVILQTIYCVNYLLTEVRNLKSDCHVHKHVFQFVFAFISKISQWAVLLLNPHQLPKELSFSFGKACAVFDFDSHMYPECVTLKQQKKNPVFPQEQKITLCQCW